MNGDGTISYAELLFWKVYRNVYLNKQLYYQLSNAEIEFKDYRNYHLKNRIKFKEIRSLLWMIEKNQYGLLKYKLENDEYIEVCKKSIVKIIKATPSNYDIINNINTEKNKFIELFQLLMKRRAFFVEYNMDLLETAIIYRKPLVLEILLNEPYSFEFSAMNIFYVNRHSKMDSNSHITDIAIKYANPNLIIQGMNERPNDWYLHYRYRSSMVQFVLNNPNLFIVPPIPKLQQSQDPQNYYLKFQLTELHEIFQIESNELQNKLLDSDYFINSYNIQQFNICVRHILKTKSSPSPTKLVNQSILFLYFRIYYKCLSNSDIPLEVQQEINEITNNETNETEKVQLFKLLIKVSKSNKLYNYYYRYYEIIEEQGLYNDVFKNLKSAGVLSKLNNLEKGDKFKLTEFIKSFVNEYDFKKIWINKILVNKIRNSIFNYVDNQEIYQEVFKSINENEIKGKLFDLPSSWNPNLKQLMKGDEKILIKDKEFIDWLSTIKRHNHDGDKDKNQIAISTNVRSKYNDKRRKGLIEFETSELTQYAIIKLEFKIAGRIKFKPIKLEPIKWSHIIDSPLTLLLIEHGLHNDIIISKRNNSLSTDFIEYHNKDNNKGCEHYSSKHKPLFIYNREVNKYQFISGLYKHFIKNIVIKYQDDYSIISNINFNLNLDSTQFVQEAIELLCKSIIKYDINRSILILNNINLHFHSNLFLKVLEEKIKKYFKSYKSVIDALYTGKADTNEKIVNNIKLWLNTIKKSNSTSYQTKSIDQIINHLYKSLIRLQGVNIKSVIEIRNLTKTQAIVLDHSVDHVVCYLNIKSPKLIKLISEFLKSAMYYYSEINDNSRKVHQFLDPQLFTFEYIFDNSTFDSLSMYFLKRSIYDFKLYQIEEFSNCLLEINRVDFFIKQLESIKIKKAQSILPNFRVLIDDYRRLNENICLLFSKVLSVTDSPNNIINFQKVIKLLESINEDPQIYLKFFQKSFRGNIKEVVSFFINQYDIKVIDKTTNIYHLSISDYIMIEYILINHPSVEFNLDNTNFELSPPSFPIIQLLLKYNKSIKFTKEQVSIVINNINSFLFYYNKGFIDENNNFIMNK